MLPDLLVQKCLIVDDAVAGFLGLNVRLDIALAQAWQQSPGILS